MHQSTHPPKQTQQQQKPLEEPPPPPSSSPSPSFSDLPTTSAAQRLRTHMDHDVNTMFEFYSDFNSSEMCAAEDIFFCGKLLPLRPNQANEEQTRRPKPTHRRKLESFDEFNGGATIREYLKGSSECRRLQRTTSQRPKPKWYVIVFGSVKVPGEMDMSDIRSRQMRRPPPQQQQPLKTTSVNGGSAWRLLKSLSCKGHDIAASVML